jgi:hypothetical protein
VPTSVRGETKSYPKRSDLRRAEARAASRRPGTSTSRPAGGSRPQGAPAGRQRPPAPASALRSAEATRRSTLQARYPVAVAPTPAVLPIPQTDPWRPAGIDMPMQRPTSPDAFHQPDRRPPMVPIAIPAPERMPDPRTAPPTAPIQFRAPAGVEVDPAEWGLDLTVEPDPALRTSVEPTETPRRLFGGGKSTAARLLVMALVIGAEGVAVTQLAGTASPLGGHDGSASAAFELTSSASDAQKAQAADNAAHVLEVQQAEAQAAELKADVKAASPAKAKAALAQYQQAKAAADRIKAAQARRDRALRNAQRDPKGAAQVMLADRGWSSSQFSCLDSLWTRESGWNYQATNASSGAYGIPQSLPGSKMASAGSDWQTNPVTQMRWGMDYIASRYGTPCGAWAHSESYGWY